MRERVRRVGREAVERVQQHVQGHVEDALTGGGDEINRFIDQRLSAILSSVKTAADSERAAEKIRNIDEEEFLTFVPDRRRFSGISTFLLGLLALVVLPGVLKLFAVWFFVAAAALFYFGYINNCKVDVPDGFEGVMCRFGKPSQETARRGRNWLFNFAEFCSFLVSQRDQVVDSENANFAADSASITLEDQKVFRVTDPARFVANTSPAAVMRILDLYGSYNALRIITSIRDSRVKFTGRDDLGNVISALNRQLGRHDVGISVVRANLPTASNAILKDLEGIRTDIRRIEAMKDEKQVRLEAEVKQVESEMRQKRKASRNSALDLQKEQITLQTSIAQQVNTVRQEAVIKARKTLEMTTSGLARAVESLKAKMEKVKAIRASFDGLRAGLDLRQAAIKRAVLKRMVPKAIEIVRVDGVGPGLGMSVGTQLFRHLLDARTGGNGGSSSAGLRAETDGEPETVDVSPTGKT